MHRIGHPGYDDDSQIPDDDYDPADAVCDHCWGDGYYHDCGEDTCCCAQPEYTDLHPCENCGATGYLGRRRGVK